MGGLFARFLLFFLDPVHALLDGAIGWLRPERLQAGYGGCSAPQKPVPIALPGAGGERESLDPVVRQFLQELEEYNRRLFRSIIKDLQEGWTPLPLGTPQEMIEAQYRPERILTSPNRTQLFLWQLVSGYQVKERDGQEN